MRQRLQEYIPLSTRSTRTEDGSDDTGMGSLEEHGAKSHDRLMLWATIAVACITLLSSIIFLFALEAASSPEGSIASHSHPNPYIHLDKLLANATFDFEPIVNFPQVSLQYQNGDVERRTREVGRDYATSFGKIYPDDRRIIADDELSTIVQFRNLDYAMERCVLQVEIPVATGNFNPEVKLSDPSHVDVWWLDARTELSRYIKGSTDYAPPRRALLATLAVSSTDSSVSESFFCRTGGYTTLELACASAFIGCTVDFWQDQRAKPRRGVFLMQYPTATNEGGPR